MTVNLLTYRKQEREKIGTERLEKDLLFLRKYHDSNAVCCLKRILRLFTNFYLHRKLLIFLINDRDCKVVDLSKTRKIYIVIESLDFTINIFWLASCFSKIKKPNSHFLGNQSGIAGVHDFIFIIVIF